MANKKLTYAQVADKLTKKIGKLEDDIKNGDRFAKASAQKMLPRLEAKKEQLFQHQEQSKQAQFHKEQNALMEKYGFGGSISKYANGGNTPPTIEDMRAKYPGYTDQELQVMLERATTRWNDLQDRNKLRGQDANYSYYNADMNPNVDGNFQYPTAATNATPNGGQETVYRRHDVQEAVAADGTKGALNRTSGYQSSISPDDPRANMYQPQQPQTPKAGETSDFGNYSSHPDAAQGAPKTGKGFGDYLGMAATYAPALYNLGKGMKKAEQTSKGAYYNPYEEEAMELMRNRRFNIDPQLAANERSYNAARKSIGRAAGGDSAAYLATLGSAQGSKQRADAAAYAQKQNMDNQYLGQEAQALTGFGQGRSQADMYTDDINARNRAARDAYLAQAATQVSQAYQNEQRMNNLRDADMMRAQSLQNMYGDYGYSYGDNGMLTGDMYYRGNR